MLASPGNRPTILTNGANLLLRSLSAGDAYLLAPHLRQVALKAGEPVAARGRPIDRVLFPETAIVAFRESAGTGPEAAMVGAEGMVGWPVLLDAYSSDIAGVVQPQPGTALSIASDTLRQACLTSESLRGSLLRFVENLTLQMTSTIAAMPEGVEKRLARWLLMLHDRSPGDALRLTHDHIGAALHVRRASVTDCLHLIEGEAIIRCTRGRLVIRDRARLQAIAGTLYGLVERHYAARIAPFGKSGGK